LKSEASGEEKRSRHFLKSIVDVEYIAFGEVLFEEHSSSFSSPYLFNGKELDRETNLSYYGARYLDMKTSLWLSVDPLAERYYKNSPYIYVSQNPINLIDPTGMSEETAGSDPPKKGFFGRLWDRWFGSSRSNSNPKQNNVGVGPIQEIPQQAGAQPLPSPTSFPWEVIKGGAETEAVSTAAGISAGTAAVGVGVALLMGRDSRPKDEYVSMYRAMSMVEYESTGGYLVDLRTSGEGPHVRSDIGYLSNAEFIQKGKNYDIIVKYQISAEAFLGFNATPYQFTPGTGKGGPIFNAAREAGLPYIKNEKGLSYGFPGLATTLFNSSIVGRPKVFINLRK
jgi:RHS repeat-associated protein